MKSVIAYREIPHTFLGKALYAREFDKVSEDGRVYATYGETDGRQTDCKIQNVKCSSENQYAAFVGAYISD